VDLYSTLQINGSFKAFRDIPHFAMGYSAISAPSTKKGTMRDFWLSVNDLEKQHPNGLRCRRTIAYVGLVLMLILCAVLCGSPHIASLRRTSNAKIIPLVKNSMLKKNDTISFVNFQQELGNLEPVPNHVSPRNPSLSKISALLAIPVGGNSKANVVPVLNHFYEAGCKIVLFHYDDTVWTDIPHYSEYVTVRALGQTKFWFAKRFLIPELLSNYEYLFLWDDDVSMDSMMWDPLQFIQTMRDYNIDLAQPALSAGVEYHDHVTKLQPNPPESTEPLLGRWTNFVEMMFPVYSVKTWSSCVWQTLPYDGVCYCGADLLWYPLCSGLSQCRFAVLDGFPVVHNNGKILAPHTQSFAYEMGHYLESVIELCLPSKYTMRSVANMSLAIPFSKEHQYDMLCTYVSKHGHDKNMSIRKMVPEDKSNQLCPRLPNWPSISIPWYPNSSDTLFSF
jgi:hypothetical protein